MLIWIFVLINNCFDKINRIIFSDRIYFFTCPHLRNIRNITATNYRLKKKKNERNKLYLLKEEKEK